VRRSLPALLEQLEADDELIVVDNASSDGTVAAVGELAPRARVIAEDRNLGFSAGCNRGAAEASGDLLVFLNPDAVPGPRFCESIRRPATDERGWAAWMGLVTADGGRVVNTEGGVVHFTGIAWAGGAGRPLDSEPPAGSAGLRDVGFVSGACLAIPMNTWKDAGGFPDAFFLYHEDVDLSLRLRLTGGRLGIEHTAVVDHEYEFAKGASKWRYMERNRLATLIRTYPGILLVLLAPALLATELALVFVSVAGGWGRQKLLAWLDTAVALPRLLAVRRGIQAGRKIGAAEFAASLTPELESPYLGRVARLVPLRWALRAYWSGVRALLRATGSSVG
jgi:GT2 family glycosyltransferase